MAGASVGSELPFIRALPPFFLVGLMIYVITHEAGHCIAGALMGWRCVRLGIGPFELLRHARGWTVRRGRIWGWHAAFVGQVPPGFSNYRREKTLTLLGGSASSVVFGLAFIAAAFNASNALLQEFFACSGILALFGVFEVVIGSDGVNLRQVLRGGTPVDDLIRDSLSEASEFTPLRPRDWPRDVVLRLAEREDPYCHYLAYVHWLDAGDTAAAAPHIQELIAFLSGMAPVRFVGMPPEMNSTNACEAAYWLAEYAGDAIAARHWFERAGPDADPMACTRATAALALAEGKSEHAERVIKQGLAQIPLPSSGSAKFEFDRLSYLLAKIG